MPKGRRLYKKADRDRLLLEHLANGENNLSIARELGLSHGTVRVYVAELVDELGARTRTHAVAIAIIEGRIGPKALKPKATK